MRFITSETFESKYYSSSVLLLLFIHTVTMVPYHQISQISQGLFLILSLPLLVLKRKTIFKDPMVITLGVVLIIQLFSWLNSHLSYPDIANSGPKLDRLAKLFSFIFIAYWLKGSIRNISILLACYLIGVFWALISYPEFITDFIRGLNGTRVDFGIKNAQYTSMFSGVCIILCAFLLAYINLYKNIDLKYLRVFSSVLLILFMMFFFSLLLISQSRQSWLAFSIVILLLPFIIKATYSKINNKTILFSYLIVTLSAILFSQSNIIKNRTGVESKTISTILNKDWDNIPMSSIGIRINSWIESYSWIKNNPWIGADESAISEVIAQSPKFISARLTGFRHLHNYHLETLVAYGLLGLAAIYFIYYWLVISTFKATKVEPNAKPFSMLAMAFLTFWIVINCFETISGRRYGVFTHNILFGCCYTFYLTQSLRTKEANKD